MKNEKLALISVYDKTGLESFAKKLISLGFQILSTGKTAQFLKNSSIPVREVSDYTGFPEILDGRVKTLHPKIHAGILARSNPQDEKLLADLKIGRVDLVVVNLYPFETAPTIENIDIGGPTLLRAAAKNFERVTVVWDPADYEEVLSVIASPKGEAISLDFRKKLAGKVFQLTARYEQAIASHFNQRSTNLRYGENPHQKAKWRVEEGKMLWSPPLQGKELSYNNILDADAAWNLVWEFGVFRSKEAEKQEAEKSDCKYVCAIVKHTSPCGVALSEKSLAEAFEKAYACDPQSAFGGIVAFNSEVDEAAAQALSKIFLEIVLAPSFSKEALAILASKKNLRLLISKNVSPPTQIVRSAGGGELIQDSDFSMEDSSQWKVVTKRTPTKEETKALQFAWKVVKHVKSNAIVFATEDQTLGIGAGQTSRIDAVKIATMKMSQCVGVSVSQCVDASTHRLTDSPDSQTVVVASDAFFPFADNIETIAKAGGSAIIQPGGSIKDVDVIATANQHNLAMVFTGVRHFKH